MTMHQMILSCIPTEIIQMILMFLIRTESPTFLTLMHGKSLQVNSYDTSCKCIEDGKWGSVVGTKYCIQF